MRVASRDGDVGVVVVEDRKGAEVGVPSRSSHSENQRRARSRMRDGHRSTVGK